MKKNKCAPAARDQPLPKHRPFMIAQPDRPPSAGRRSPRVHDAGPRATRSGRDGARNGALVIDDFSLQRRGHWSIDILSGASRIAARQAAGNARGKPVVGCGTPASEPALSTPQRGGQRSRPRAGAESTITPVHQRFSGRNLTRSKPDQGSLQFHVRFQRKGDFLCAEIKSDSCPKVMSDKRGLGGFRVQLRHAKAWRVVPGNCQAHTPQGSRREVTRGGFQQISNCPEIAPHESPSHLAI